MQPDKKRAEAGFTMFELMIAMGVMLVILALASQLIASAFSIRRREDAKSDAVADTQNALNIMSREIGSAGANLPTNITLPSNGIVAANSDAQNIRIVTNPNNNATIADTDEDVIYKFYTDTTATPTQQYIVRYNVNTNTTTVLANRIDSMVIRYYDQKVNYTTTAGTCGIDNVTKTTVDPATGTTATTAAAESTDRSKSKYVVVAVCVNLPAVGRPGQPGYREAWQVQLTSDVTLRNANLAYY